MKENADNAKQVQEEIGMIFSNLRILRGDMKIGSYKNFTGENRVTMSFEEDDFRMNMSVGQANELALKLGFVLQDIEKEEKDARKPA